MIHLEINLAMQQCFLSSPDLGLEEEYLYGSLYVTIHKLQGLDMPCGKLSANSPQPSMAQTIVNFPFGSHVIVLHDCKKIVKLHNIRWHYGTNMLSKFCQTALLIMRRCAYPQHWHFSQHINTPTSVLGTSPQKHEILPER